MTSKLDILGQKHNLITSAWASEERSGFQDSQMLHRGRGQTMQDISTKKQKSNQCKKTLILQKYKYKEIYNLYNK